MTRDRVVLSALVLSVSFLTIGCVEKPPEKTFDSLYLAAQAGDLGAVKRMIAAGADVNSKGPKKMTPLMGALVSQRSDLISFLIDKGARLDVFDDRGWGIVHYAASNGNIEILEKLKSEKADLEILTIQDGASPYQLSKFYNQPKAAKWFEAQGVDLTIRDLKGPSRSGGL